MKQTFSSSEMAEYAEIFLGYIRNPLSADGFQRQIDLLTVKIDQWPRDIEWATANDKADKAVEFAKAVNEYGRKRAEFEKLALSAQAAKPMSDASNMPDTDHFRHWHSFAVQHTAWAKASAVSGDAEAASAHADCVSMAFDEINRVRNA